MSYEAVMQEIRDGALMTIDGATGTELQRRGAPMHKGAWCALATASNPDVLHGIHADYIRAGARVVTTNTFATTREVLEPLGFGDRFEALNRQAAEIAIAARDSTPGNHGPVLVAGSISHTRPSIGDGWSPKEHEIAKFEATCTEMAAIFKDAGCDLILAEMMGCPIFTPCVMRAAKANGLPLWLGISTIRLDDDVLRTFTNDSLPLAEVFEPILAEGGADVVGIMHSRPEVTLEALEMLKGSLVGSDDGVSGLTPETGLGCGRRPPVGPRDRRSELGVPLQTVARSRRADPGGMLRAERLAHPGDTRPPGRA